MGIALTIFFAYPALWVTFLHGFGNGMFIEGSSTYGHAPTWKKKKPKPEKDVK
jgi:hypothetical protein